MESGGEEQGGGKAGHARDADPSQVGEVVQAVHPAGRPERQLGAMARQVGRRRPGRVP